MRQGIKVDQELKDLAVEEAIATRDVGKVAREFGVAPGTLYKWVQKSKGKNFHEDKQDLFDKFFDLIEANHKDLSGYLTDGIYEERTENLLRFCLICIPGLKGYYKERLRGEKNSPTKEQSSILKKFCYLLYELED